MGYIDFLELVYIRLVIQSFWIRGLLGIWRGLFFTGIALNLCEVGGIFVGMRSTRGKGTANKNLREAIRIKYGGKCAYTGRDLDDKWQIDHVEPVYRGVYGISACDVYSPDNMVPCVGLINHYKRWRTVEEFRVYIADLPRRLRGLPKCPVVAKSIRRKEYVTRVAELFGITGDTVWDGKFYMDSVKCHM